MIEIADGDRESRIQMLEAELEARRTALSKLEQKELLYQKTAKDEGKSDEERASAYKAADDCAIRVEARRNAIRILESRYDSDRSRHLSEKTDRLYERLALAKGRILEAEADCDAVRHELDHSVGRDAK